MVDQCTANILQLCCDMWPSLCPHSLINSFDVPASHLSVDAVLLHPWLASPIQCQVATYVATRLWLSPSSCIKSSLQVLFLFSAFRLKTGSRGPTESSCFPPHEENFSMLRRRNTEALSVWTVCMGQLRKASKTTGSDFGPKLVQEKFKFTLLPCWNLVVGCCEI